MESRDLLIRQIEQLGMVLRRLLSGPIGPADVAEVLSITQVEQAIDEAFGLTAGTLEGLSSQALIKLLQAHPAYSETNVDLLADLYARIADETRGQGRSDLFRRKAIELMDHLNAISNTYDPERHGKVARLRALL